MTIDGERKGVCDALDRRGSTPQRKGDVTEPGRLGNSPGPSPKTDIAIVGAGVAGARLAYLLARGGFDVTLFDPRPAWEKPCGGGLTDKLVTEFGDVVEGLTTARSHYRLEVLFSSGRRASMAMDRPLVTVSRRALGELLLDRAVKAGARFLAEKVLSVRREAGRNVLATRSGEHSAGLLVGADGVNSLVRRSFLKPFPKEELWIARGALLPVEVSLPVTIKFFNGCHGYAWIFPRKGRTSVGVMARRPGGSSRGQLLERLREFASAEFARSGLPAPDLGRPYGWPLPGLRPRAFADNVVSGPCWALVGDASGAVDPLTGEGIYYALKTAHLLADALTGGRPEAYGEAWRSMAGASVAKVAKKLDAFYHPLTLRALGFLLDYSPSVRDLTRDLVCGSQRYDALKARVKAELPAYVKEAVFSLIASRRGEAQDRQE
jgi:flavin-dependent dehydrogenase